MITIHRGCDFATADPQLQAMFEDRKRQFVDLLGWDVPVIDGRYEIDQFDGASCTYLVASAPGERHIGSMRLLPTTSPHILDTLFPMLCDADIPRGPYVREITRLCLPSRLGATRRLEVRNRLISAMVDHTLAEGIVRLTGIVDMRFLRQVEAMGWRCSSLGSPMRARSGQIGAFRIDLDADTPAALRGTGIYQPGTIALPCAAAA